MLRRQLLQSTASIAALSATPLIAPATAAVGTPLESAVNRYVKEQRRRGLVAGNERTAWSVYDITAQRKLVSINENIPLQAASLIKPFVCQAFFFMAHYHGYQYGPKTRALMEAMIRDSSNTATNSVMKIVGGPQRCQQILRQYGPGIFQQTSIVEYIPANGRTYLNKASARDYSRFLYATWKSSLPYAKEMRRLMGLYNKDRLKTNTQAVPSNVRVYDKTGSTSRLCGNIGIMVGKGVNGKDYPYTMIGVIERSNRTQNYPLWMKQRGDVIRGVSSIVYQHLKKAHRLT